MWLIYFFIYVVKFVVFGFNLLKKDICIFFKGMISFLIMRSGMREMVWDMWNFSEFVGLFEDCLLLFEYCSFCWIIVLLV